MNKINYPLNINPQNMINNQKSTQLIDNRKLILLRIYILLLKEFKSDPNKTTMDNCKMYLEQKNMNVIPE